MWFFEYFFKKGLYKPQKTIYNASENKEKQHNLQRINNTKPQHNKTAHLWTKSEEFYYEDLRVKICTGFYQDGE